MSNQITRKFLEENILTTKEACEILGVSRQTLMKYLKEERLITLKDIQSTHLFYRKDILEFRDNMYKQIILQNALYNKELHRGNTYEAEDYVLDNVDLDAVVKVKLYQGAGDAVIDGYFTITEPHEMNKLINIDAPTCILFLNTGDEVWLQGLLCGYGGTGPSHTVGILSKMGIEESQRNLVYSKSKIEYVKNKDNTWEVIIPPSPTINTEDYPNKSNDGFTTFFYNNKIVYIYKSYYKYRANNFNVTGFIKNQLWLLGNIEKVLFLSEEYALNNGYFYISKGEEFLYQLIIIDSAGRELWIPVTIDPVKPIPEQERLKEILDILGYKKPEEDDLKSKITKFFKNRPFLNDIEEINLNK